MITLVDKPDTKTFQIGEGTISVSIIENRDGLECWIHDLTGEGIEAAELMAKARSQAKEWGYSVVMANVNNPKLADILVRHGWSIEQLILKGVVGEDGNRSD